MVNRSGPGRIASSWVKPKEPSLQGAPLVQVRSSLVTGSGTLLMIWFLAEAPGRRRARYGGSPGRSLVIGPDRRSDSRTDGSSGSLSQLSIWAGCGNKARAG